MRPDMYKVIVERPRRGKRVSPLAMRLRNDLDGPGHLSMRAPYDYRELNENLNPRAERRRQRDAELAARRRILDENTLRA
jgi:hypothetical protein